MADEPTSQEPLGPTLQSRNVPFCLADGLTFSMVFQVFGGPGRIISATSPSGSPGLFLYADPKNRIRGQLISCDGSRIETAVYPQTETMQYASAWPATAISLEVHKTEQGYELRLHANGTVVSSTPIEGDISCKVENGNITVGTVDGRPGAQMTVGELVIHNSPSAEDFENLWRYFAEKWSLAGATK